MNKYFKIVVNWIKQNKQEFLIIVGILLISAFLRFYRISEYMTFLGDEGRDAIVVKDLLVNHHFPFIGPPTSIGDMYNGPLYYYMMSIPMAIFWLNPEAAAGMIALISTAIVGLIYFLTRQWFGKWSAVSASILYSLSPVNIIYSHSSWNPNPAPFFALFAIIGLFNARKYKNFLWLIVTGIATAFAVQMHYLALILLPILGLLWLYEVFLQHKEKYVNKHFFRGSLFGIISFLLLMSPLAIFDFRHNFMNYSAISKFFLGDRATTVNLNIFNTLGRVVPIYSHNLVERYIAGENNLIILIVSILILAPIIWGIYLFIKKRYVSWPFLVLGVWLLGGIMGLSLYKQTIYDHYLGFLNPVPFILLGSLASFVKILKRNHQFYLKGFLLILTVILLMVSIQRSPLLISPNNQLKRTQDVSKFVISESQNKPFNFALIAEHNYDAAYQYYLDVYGHKPKKVPFEITDQLFVVCEDAVCKPVGHPKYEIAGFGLAKIESEQNFNGVKVFKIVHNPGGHPQ